MKGVAVGDTPLGPNFHILAEGTVAATGYIGEDSVKLEVLALFQLDGGEHGSVKVGNHQSFARHSTSLMDKHVGSLVVGIICNKKTGRGSVMGVESFNDLGSLGTRGGTHVEAVVVGLNVEEQRGNHRNCLLPAQISNLGFSNQESLKVLERLRLSHNTLGSVDLPCELTRIPGKLGWGVVLFAFKLDILHVGNVCVLDDVVDSLGVGSGACNSESQGKFLFEAGHEFGPFFGGHDVLLLCKKRQRI